jgi:hypothetical protein
MACHLPYLGSFKKAKDSTTCSKCSQHNFEDAQNELTQTDFYLGLHHAEQSFGVALCATNLSAQQPGPYVLLKFSR